jgi:hypothetical protein
VKTLCLAALFVSAWTHAQGPYSLVLETADTLTIPSYYTRGDTLGFPGGRVAKRDVFMLQKDDERYMFRYRNGHMVRFSAEGPMDTCWFAKAFRKKYEGSDFYIGPTLIIDTAMTRKASFICCYMGEVNASNIKRHLRKVAGSGGTDTEWRGRVLRSIVVPMLMPW